MQQNNFVTVSELKPGTVVSIPVFLVYRHKGIVSDRWYNGKPMVISNSARAGGVREETWDDFAAGCVVTVEGYPGTRYFFQVLAHARALIGTRYDLLKWNCENFIACVHGLKPSSPQLAATMAIVVLFGLVAVGGR